MCMMVSACWLHSATFEHTPERSKPRILHVTAQMQIEHALLSRRMQGMTRGVAGGRTFWPGEEEVQCLLTPCSRCQNEIGILVFLGYQKSRMKKNFKIRLQHKVTACLLTTKYHPSDPSSLHRATKGCTPGYIAAAQLISRLLRMCVFI